MHDKHAIVHRIVKPDLTEVDENQIIERHGADLMPGLPVHLVSLRGLRTSTLAWNVRACSARAALSAERQIAKRSGTRMS
jgi:hypothetical protein